MKSNLKRIDNGIVLEMYNEDNKVVTITEFINIQKSTKTIIEDYNGIIKQRNKSEKGKIKATYFIELFRLFTDEEISIPLFMEKELSVKEIQGLKIGENKYELMKTHHVVDMKNKDKSYIKLYLVNTYRNTEEEFQNLLNCFLKNGFKKLK